MKNKIIALAKSAAFILILSLPAFFLSCKTDLLGSSEQVDAASPQIENHPVSKKIGHKTPVTLSVKAVSTDGGTISYRWYLVKDENKSEPTLVNESEIDSDLNSVLTVNTENVGKFYYYAEVCNTNTGRSVTRNTKAFADSKVVCVEVAADNIIKYFSNNEQGSSGYIFHEQNKTLDKSIKILEDISNLKKTGYRFLIWNTKQDGSGDNYEVGDTYKENKDLNLYAQWAPITYTLTLKNPPSPDRKIFATFDKTLPKLSPLPVNAGFNFGGCYIEHEGKRITVYDKDGNGTYIWKIDSDKEGTLLWGNEIGYENTMDAENPNPPVYLGSAETELKPLSLRGATFKGWFASSDYSGNAVTKIPAGESGKKTFYAKWEFTKYRIDYELNSGTNAPENPAEFTIKDEVVLKEPHKDGYDFVGWYDNATFGGNKIVKIEKKTSENVKLYAKWIRHGDWAITYILTQKTTISPPVNSEKNPAGYNVETSDTERLLHPPKPRKGYQFEGWYDNPAFSGNKIEKIEKTKTDALTFYAKWKADVYKLRMFSSDTESKDIDITYDSPFPHITAPSQDGANFTGYFAEKKGKGRIYYGGDGAGIGVCDFTEDRTVYAAWKYIIEYKNVLEAENPNPILYDGIEEVKIEQLSLPGKRNFEGWFASEDYTGDAVTKIAAGETGKKIFYAKWASVQYNIEYELNGGANDSSNPQKYTVDDEIILKAPDKFGYELEGWYDNAAFTGISVEKIAKGSIGHKKFFAKWKLAPDWKISYVLYEGTTASEPVNSADNPRGYNIESPDKTLHNPNERKGYDFEGWYFRHITDEWLGTYTEEKITKIETAKLVSEKKHDITIYAKWIAKKYNIEYKPKAGTVNLANELQYPTKYTIEDEITLTEAMISLPKYFVSWNIISKGQWIPIYKIVRGSTGDIVLYAKYTDKKKITYHLNGGTFTETPPSEYDANTAPFEIPNPEKLGCNFAGWYAFDDFKGKKIIKLAGKPDENNGVFSVRDLYAKWDKIKYTIEYELNGAKAEHGNPAEYYVDTETIALKEPKRPGAIFKGWYNDHEFTAPRIETIAKGSTGNRKLYAKWDLIQYKVEYDTNGGKLPGGVSNPTYYNVGQVLKTPLPTKKNLIFAGWYDKDGKGWRKLDAETLGDNVESKKLFARWINLTTVEGGSFKRKDENGKECTVNISSFYMSDHEVTQKEFKEVMGDNPSLFKGNELPVEKLNWYHAIAYCNKLSIKEGLEPVYDVDGMNVERWKNLKFSDIPTSVNSSWEYATMYINRSGYRLPTEAEWEFAASGGSKSNHFTYSGSNTLDDIAWHKKNSSGKTHYVKTKAANELGLYDMSGNVLEWCWDKFGADNYSSAGDCTNPTGPYFGINDMHVIRGGSYFNSKEDVFKPSYHAGAEVSRTEENIGFRVVCSKFFTEN